MGQNNIKPTGNTRVTHATPAQNSPGNSAAGPVGATPTQPNPYKVPGGSGADAALEPESNVEVRPPNRK